MDYQVPKVLQALQVFPFLARKDNLVFLDQKECLETQVMGLVGLAFLAIREARETVELMDLQDFLDHRVHLVW